MEGQNFPVTILDEPETFTLLWTRNSSGAPYSVQLDAGTEVFFDPENTIFHYRTDDLVRTVTSQIEVRISTRHEEWEMELVVDPEDGLEPPSVLVSGNQLFLSDNGYNFSVEHLFRNFCQVLHNRAFNPHEVMPENGEYGSYTCNFETGEVAYYTGDPIDNVPPKGPKKAIVKMLRAFPAKLMSDEAVTMIAGAYEIIPGVYDGKTGDIQNWRFDARGDETFRQDHLRAFVEDDVLIAELELGQAVIVDVLDRKDSTHPMFAAEARGRMKSAATQAESPQSAAPTATDAPKRGLLDRLFGKS
ncbi:hypothetical protein [Hoeflea sp. EC-HK425]|uniref:hypothetical protein n=1 Tax=Hoeflea sp. EC-HK425 TaxID=2038388 RepID=UPI001256C291|nr:hypothetical protein [Hoeflea sp. EC-HK425]VVT35095.1 hypothetical protein HOE425_340348 [Hoeflea sp. EC-HK425]